MKIRIKGNSLRVRLTRSEVEQFGKEGYLEERTEFGNTSFVYALRSIKDITALSASFVNGVMTMDVPASIVNEWVTTERVGYDNNMDTGNGKQLFLLLEKDFKCIDAPPYEDQSDNYEHPNLSCS